MIDLYTWPTPNGHKVHIMLEETGIPYRVHPVNIGAGEQFDPSFLKIHASDGMDWHGTCECRDLIRRDRYPLWVIMAPLPVTGTLSAQVPSFGKPRGSSEDAE